MRKNLRQPNKMLALLMILMLYLTSKLILAHYSIKDDYMLELITNMMIKQD